MRLRCCSLAESAALALMVVASRDRSQDASRAKNCCFASAFEEVALTFAEVVLTFVAARVPILVPRVVEAVVKKAKVVRRVARVLDESRHFHLLCLRAFVSGPAVWYSP